MEAKWPELRRHRALGPDKRKDARISAYVRMRFRVVKSADLNSQNEQFQKGRIKDISDSGIRIEFTSPLSEGQEVEIYFEDPRDGKSYYSIAKIIRSKQRFDHYDFGLKILKKEQI